MSDINTTKVITDKVRFSYAYVFHPRQSEGGESKYSVQLIIPKSDTATIQKLRNAINAAAAAGIGKFGGKLPPKGTLKVSLHDGDAERPDDETVANAYYLNCTAKQKPGIVKFEGGKFVEVTDESEFYSGCYGRASVNFYAYNTSGNRGIACGINNILLLEKGDYLGGRVSAESDFAGFRPAEANPFAEGDMPDEIF